MTKRRRKANTGDQPGRRSFRRASRHVGWWIAGLVALALAATGGWLAFRSGEAPSSGLRLPGPAGGRDVTQDVNTLVGQPAPSFTLATAGGRTYAVTPGRGRPTILIFHMGVG